MRALRVVAAVAWVVAAGAGQVHAQSATAATVGLGRPHVRWERVAGEVVGGTYAGVMGYFIGRGVGTLATSMISTDNDRIREIIVNDIGIAGSAFAIGGTVYAIGSMGAEAGSFPSTMVGVSAGVAASLLVSKFVFQGRMPVDEASSRRKWLVATLEASLPALGATIAFNSSRRWQR